MCIACVNDEADTGSQVSLITASSESHQLNNAEVHFVQQCCVPPLNGRVWCSPQAVCHRPKLYFPKERHSVRPRAVVDIEEPTK
jgi:hypothetical protein